MSDIDDVLARLRDDREFEEALRRDPGEALRWYDLSDDDLELLSPRITGAEPPPQVPWSPPTV